MTTRREILSHPMAQLANVLRPPEQTADLPEIDVYPHDAVPPDADSTHPWRFYNWDDWHQEPTYYPYLPQLQTVRYTPEQSDLPPTDNSNEYIWPVWLVPKNRFDATSAWNRDQLWLFGLYLGSILSMGVATNLFLQSQREDTSQITRRRLLKTGAVLIALSILSGTIPCSFITGGEAIQFRRLTGSDSFRSLEESASQAARGIVYEQGIAVRLIALRQCLLMRQSYDYLVEWYGKAHPMMTLSYSPADNLAEFLRLDTDALKSEFLRPDHKPYLQAAALTAGGVDSLLAVRVIPFDPYNTGTTSFDLPYLDTEFVDSVKGFVGWPEPGYSSV